MLRLRVTVLVDAPLTVAFDVARARARPWSVPLEEVAARRPWRDEHTAAQGWRRLTHTRTFAATGAGTLLTEQVDCASALPGVLGLLAEGIWLRRRVLRTMQAHLDAYAAAAGAAARSVVQVVGAAVVDGDRVLVARRRGGPFDGRWEFPGGKVEPGEEELAALVRECAEELGMVIAPQAFLGEVVLDAAVAGGSPGASTLRVWWARPERGSAVAREHAELRWVRAGELEGLDWIDADRPLLPAVRALLARA